MPALEPEGQRLVQELAGRHGFGEEAVAQMLAAIVAGKGRMAQFEHAEFGGRGQWMSGGMLMIGDMFNQKLKGRVNGLCNDLSDALASLGPLDSPAQSQSQSRGGGESGGLPDTPFFAPSSSSRWWPSELGTPSAVGAQDSIRYAYFADARRLVVDDDDMRIYDTLDHHISGFSQQQGGTDAITLSSQHGTVDLSALPIVAGGEAEGGEPGRAPSPPRPDDDRTEGSTAANPSAAPGDGGRAAAPGWHGSDGTVREDPVQLIARLGELREQGLLTDEEFTAKKQELLSRL